MLTGENGILTQAQNSQRETEIGKEKEQIALAYNGAIAEKQSTDVTADDLNRNFGYNDTKATATGSNPITVTFTESGRKYEIDANGNITEAGSGTTPEEPETGSTLGTVKGTETSNTTVQDSLGNKVVVPAGFKVVNPTDNVEDGIIIEDVNHGATAGSQFVWIPVGEGIKKKDGTTFDIKLSRYTFDSSGTPTDQGSNVIESYYQELNTGRGNTTAKEDIESEEEGFRGSAIKNGGYYIGRYEARTATERTDKTAPKTQITVKPDEFVYNYVTQPQAADLSRKMYSDSNFESDLVNSYAWDTAIDFLQKCDDRTDKTTPYSQQTSLNTESLTSKGTNETETEDVICNIYDMASNCYEWTTETCDYGSEPCLLRGGGYDDLYYTADHIHGSTSSSFDYDAFRPLLYL